MTFQIDADPQTRPHSLEARLCANQEIALVGRGNSAGPAAAALFLLESSPPHAEIRQPYIVGREESFAALHALEVHEEARVRVPARWSSRRLSPR
jgi:hypothetical protein